MTNRLEEKISYGKKLANIQLDTINQLMIANQELNRKDIEVTTLETKNALLKNELKVERENFNKPSRAIMYI